MRSTEVFERNDEQRLREALSRSLSRVHAHTQNRSIGIISPNLEANTAEQNAEARHLLTMAIKQAGYGYSHVKGMGKERDAEPLTKILGLIHHMIYPDAPEFLIKNGISPESDEAIVAIAREIDMQIITVLNG
jgi:hypothetical protein